MHTNKEFHTIELLESDAETPHRALEEEYAFYQAVKAGDLEFVLDNCRQKAFTRPEGMGILSSNPLTNIKYHFVVTAAMLARQCLQGGMEFELSFRLSDFYIAKLDALTTVESVAQLHDTMVIDYTKRMYALHNNDDTVSKSIVLCKEYIYNHLHDRITIETLAEYANLSPSYLSRLFKKEVGVSVSDYIRNKKIERAENLLKFSDYSLIEITNYLAFSSQSHFIQTFKKYTGLSPQKYRDKYQRSIW